MSRHVRGHPADSCFFVTARLADRDSDLLLREVDRLRHVTRLTMDRYPMRIEAIAILPAAIHTVWTLPEGDIDVAARWAMLKALFARGLPAPPGRTPGRICGCDTHIWLRRLRQHRIRDAAEFARHVEMIHASPVEAGLCAHPADWLHSSVHRALHRSDTRTLPGQRVRSYGATALYVT